MPSTVDTIKAAFTFATASLVALGGMVAIFYLPASAGDTKVVIGGFVGASLQFLFSQETQTRTARQTLTATAAGQAAMNGNGHA